MYSLVLALLFFKVTKMKYQRFNSILRAIRLSLQVAINPVVYGTQTLAKSSRFLTDIRMRSSPVLSTTKEIQ